MKMYYKIKYKSRRVLKRMLYPSPAPPGVILMYHRVGDMTTDPWEMFVSEKYFKSHLEFLKKHYAIHLLADLDDVLRTNKDGKRNIFITFDDGCLDNYDTAFPLLKEYDLPATFFIPTVNLDQPTVFWWEVLDYLFWQKPVLPEKFELHLAEKKFEKNLSETLQKRDQIKESAWSANREQAPSPRCSLYLEICDWIRVKTPEEQQKLTNQLIKLTGEDLNGNHFFQKMTKENILSLSKNNCEIGGHTIHHPALKFQEYSLQEEEISDSILQLKNLTDQPVVSFAYPHGEFNEDTLSLMQQCGIKYACSTEWGSIYRNTNKLTLPRMLVQNRDAQFLKIQLNYLFKP